MILSSCGCKVSWALRGGCGSCGSLLGLHVLSTQQARCVRHPCFCKQSCRPRFGKIHRILPNHPSPNLRIFRWGREIRRVRTVDIICPSVSAIRDHSQGHRQAVLPPHTAETLAGACWTDWKRCRSSCNPQKAGQRLPASCSRNARCTT